MDKIDVLGVKVALVSKKKAYEEVLKLISRKKQCQITTPNPEHVMLAQKDVEFKEIINESDLAIPDGIGLVKVMQRRIRNKKDVERVTGVDMMKELLLLAERRGFRAGLMGGRKEICQEAINKIKGKFPDLKIEFISAHKDIKRSNIEDEKIIKEINDKKIDFLFVAYGAPWQEKWINRNLKKLPSVRLAMGVGGAFDFWAEKRKRASERVQKLGLEWLFRLVQEPWRIKRQIKLVIFWFKTR